ncbi:MAG TPA: thiamine pyrophosphate-dependent dehydrogenase E1 component subunit alpha [Terriglobia bacterium]|nr:thiamine pyrophosphate-dependent dehydrogenase E1 component subunit alpha [Terriglobia bacterium]
MKRYPMFDPPEYVDWKPAPDIIEEYQLTVGRDSERARIISSLSRNQLLDMYAGMVRFRLHDITLRRWVKQGVLAKAWLGTGEEAVTIGSVHALDRKIDKVGPMIRNAGACHEMGVPLADMLTEYLATADSPSRGKDLHVGSMSHGVIAPVSQVAALTPVVAGIALAFKQRGERGVVLTWIGDGATKTTAFHEGMNLAAVLKVPAVYVLQNNQIALGTRLDQHQAGPFTAWSKAYGITGFSCDGNNVLDTFAATKLAVDLARGGGGPAIVIAGTFRMGGHATHDEAEAREICGAELFEHWGKRDPIGMYECWLETHGATRATLEETEQKVIAELAQAEKEALASREENMPKPESAIQGVYAETAAAPAEKWSEPEPPRAGSIRKTPSR